MSVKTITLPRNLFVVNQLVLLGEVAFACGMLLQEQKKRHVAEINQMQTMVLAHNIMGYADRSVMPQELIDEYEFRVMVALIDVKPDDLDTPEDEK